MEISGVVIVGGTHGALALARSLGAQKVPVVNVVHGASLARWSRFVDETVQWPGPHDDQALTFLMDAAQRHGWRGHLLVAGGDAEVRLISENRAQLSTVYTTILPEWDALRWLCEKPLLYRRAAELGVRTPLTYDLPILEGEAARTINFPVVLKPNMGGGNDRFTKAKVVRADDYQSLMRAYRDAAEQIGAQNIVVQELIPGGVDTQLSYAALWKDGEPLGEFTACRKRQFPVDFGYTSTCVEVIEEPRATEMARAMLRSVKFNGLAEVEFKRDDRDDTLRLLDINPRPWSWFGLCSAAGMDLGAMMWQVAKGQPTPSSVARQGVSWMYLVRDLAAAGRLMLRGQVGVTDYLRSCRNVRCWATFAINDPLPGLMDLPLTAWRVLTRRVLGWR